MRYRLRTLLLAIGVVPPALAALWYGPCVACPLLAWVAIVGLSIDGLVTCWRNASQSEP